MQSLPAMQEALGSTPSTAPKRAQKKKKKEKCSSQGQQQQHTPVISELWGAEAGGWTSTQYELAVYSELKATLDDSDSKGSLSYTAKPSLKGQKMHMKQHNLVCIFLEFKEVLFVREQSYTSQQNKLSPHVP